MNLNSGITISIVKSKTSILDRNLSKGKGEVSLSCFALLFSEVVQYCQNRVFTVPELQNKLSEIGYDIGTKFIDILMVREKNYKREIKLLNILLFIKSTLWKNLFGYEADKLELANDDDKVYYIIEKEPLVNKFISVPKDKGSLNCAVFTAGIIEAVLCGSGFPAKVTGHWHKGTTYMIKFDEQVVAREKQLDER
ncbi:trafficking protein particle complex subunit, putative [Pediculus humanus corporis]|uniref:Trafficking protein particle complex subunit 5 n=1 Tax=Pediculus humanus subsp. corporis TaxID=121224 RepID=E0VWU3_PEDHC|nr:trafficking protein particle complex subunit, putative [Pediculus humanus corporis]EEB17849.1 trafficking protein particle complex subunit, putative [Pediculus humanus corporis]